MNIDLLSNPNNVDIYTTFIQRLNHEILISAKKNQSLRDIMRARNYETDYSIVASYIERKLGPTRRKSWENIILGLSTLTPTFYNEIIEKVVFSGILDENSDHVLRQTFNNDFKIYRQFTVNRDARRFSGHAPISFLSDNYEIRRNFDFLRRHLKADNLYYPFENFSLTLEECISTQRAAGNYATSIKNAISIMDDITRKQSSYHLSKLYSWDDLFAITAASGFHSAYNCESDYYMSYFYNCISALSGRNPSPIVLHIKYSCASFTDTMADFYGRRTKNDFARRAHEELHKDCSRHPIYELLNKKRGSPPNVALAYEQFQKGDHIDKYIDILGMNIGTAFDNNLRILSPRADDLAVEAYILVASSYAEVALDSGEINSAKCLINEALRISNMNEKLKTAYARSHSVAGKVYAASNSSESVNYFEKAKSIYLEIRAYRRAAAQQRHIDNTEDRKRP